MLLRSCREHACFHCSNDLENMNWDNMYLARGYSASNTGHTLRSTNPKTCGGSSTIHDYLHNSKYTGCIDAPVSGRTCFRWLIITAFTKGDIDVEPFIPKMVILSRQCPISGRTFFRWFIMTVFTKADIDAKEYNAIESVSCLTKWNRDCVQWMLWRLFFTNVSRQEDRLESEGGQI